MTQFDELRALIIEDDESSIMVLASLLKHLQVATEAFTTGDDTEAFVANALNSDVVFVDLEMPRMNGYQVLSLLREHPALDSVPIVAYTTHISHMSQARNAGFDGFLGKPLDMQRFADQLEQIVNGQPVWEAP